MPDMASEGKKTEPVKVWLSEPLELELRRLADLEERKLSDYLGLVLRRHVYGHASRMTDASRSTQPAE